MDVQPAVLSQSCTKYLIDNQIMLHLVVITDLTVFSQFLIQMMAYKNVRKNSTFLPLFYSLTELKITPDVLGISRGHRDGGRQRFKWFLTVRE